LVFAFSGYVYYAKGTQAFLEYITGYSLEKALSLDNIFVFILIFSYFKVSEEFKHKVLFWGVFGAIVFRAIFIFAGIELIKLFHWMIYIFGIILIVSAIKLLITEEKEFHPEETLVYKIAKRLIPLKAYLQRWKILCKRGQKSSMLHHCFCPFSLWKVQTLCLPLTRCPPYLPSPGILS
jgi:tellurite resistance protein TerC